MKKRIAVFLGMLFMMMLFIVPGSVYAADDVKVTSVKFTENSDGKYQVTWNLTNCPSEVTVTVYLSTDITKHKGTELGSIKSGTVGSLTVQIPETESGYYHFMIKVVPLTGNTVYAYTEDAFFYDDPDGADPLNGVTIGRNEDTVYAAWNGDFEAVLCVYDADTKELLVRTDAQSEPASAEIPDGHKNVTVGAAAYINGSIGRFTPVDCYEKDIPSVTDLFGDSDMTSVEVYTVEAPSDAAGFRLFLNNEECAGQDGEYKAELEEGENRLVAFVTDKSGKTAALEKTITLDSTPPVILLEGIGTDIKTTNRNICINGYSEEGVLLTCDNEAVALTGRCFSIKKTLSYGSQTIKLEAEDEAGNVTVCEISAECSFWSADHVGLIFILILAAAGAAGELYLLIIRQKRRRDNNEESH